MKTNLTIYVAAAVLATIGAAPMSAQQQAGDTVPVTPETFIRAESDLYLSAVALKEGGFGKFEHHRELSPIDAQTIIRMNRDTLYSAAVFDLDAGPVTVTLPDAGKRFMSLQLISQDEYSPPAQYGAGKHVITKQLVGTRYVLVGVRTLVDPSDPADVSQVHALQDAIKVEQKSLGKFEVPKWDPVSQKKIRDALKRVKSRHRITKYYSAGTATGWRSSASDCRTTAAAPCNASAAMIAATTMSGHPVPVPNTPRAASNTARLPSTSLRVQIQAERMLASPLR
jgi:hypothetical protein